MGVDYYNISISSGDGYVITVSKMLTKEQFEFIKYLDMLFDQFSSSIGRPSLSVELYDKKELKEDS